MISAIATIQGLRRPMRSEIAPVSGASTATQTPTIVFARLQSSWPCTGSPMTVFVKYVAKT